MARRGRKPSSGCFGDPQRREVGEREGVRGEEGEGCVWGDAPASSPADATGGG